MLLYIQFPFADSRKFLDNTRRLNILGWPLPTPDTEFVRDIEGTIERKLSASRNKCLDNSINPP